jgi:hypothetical protein
MNWWDVLDPCHTMGICQPIPNTSSDFAPQLLTQSVPSSWRIPGTRVWSLNQHHPGRSTDSDCMSAFKAERESDSERKGKLTARPHIGILPAKQKSAPNAKALKMSVPRRIPPSIAIGIRPLATGPHSRRTSNVYGTLSSWRPPWFEMMTPSRPWSMARRTSSGV